MLVRLSVENLAVVEKATADFAAGLNVITGETGAGKSVLMGALDLVTGGRADGGVVRDGAKEARVEAEFVPSSAVQADVIGLLEELGLPQEEDGRLLIRRTVGAAGGGRAWLNDSPTTIATLRRFGRLIVDIHGPRANQKILEERFQRETLDAFGGITRAGAAMSAYVKAYAEMEDLDRQIAALADAGDADELDLLRYQVGELEGANLTDDDETIAERHAAVAHAEEIVSGANALTEALGGDTGASAILSTAIQQMRGLARHFPEAGNWAQEAEELAVRTDELSRTIAEAASRVDSGDESLAALDERLTVVNRLKRKYLKGGEVTVTRLLRVLAEKRARLDDLAHRDERLAELEAARATVEKAVRRMGADLTEARRTVSEKLAKAVTKALRDLGFLQAKFFVALEACDPTPDGCERIVYMFEPNPGEAARPLAAIASSGETARVMLALKGVLAAHDSTDLLVFDEIDANIGGEVGRAVGEKMRKVATHRQVIAITHLPQSAAFGTRHLVVSKSVSGGRTRTVITEADGEDRVREIARMLGGEKLTSVVRKHAEELLSLSR